MKVVVEIKTLLYKIEQYNPGVDLDGLKAYLFDLMLQPGGGVEETVAAAPPEPVAVVTRPAPLPEPTRTIITQSAPERPAPPLPRTVPSGPSPGGPSLGGPPIDSRGVYRSTPAPLSAGAAAKKADRERRRANSTAGAFQNMTSKQILSGLYNEEATRDDNRQFTGEGRDPRPGEDSGGDIEI